MLARGIEISELRTLTGSFVGSLLEENTLEVETERGLKTAQKTFSVSESQQKKLTDKVSSVTAELSSIRVERSYFNTDLNEMIVSVQ